MDRLRLSPLLIALAVALPSVAQAQTTSLTTAGGHVFDIETTGSVQSGASTPFGGGPYQGCFDLTVNSAAYFGGAPTTSADGRTLTFPDAALSGSLHVQRVVYVPATGGDFVRYIDVITNMGASSTTATVGYKCRMSNFGGTSVRATSTGDTVVDATDDWATANDTFSGYPALGFVFQGPGAPTRVASNVFDASGSIDWDSFTWSYSVSVPAGGRVALVEFGIQKADTDDAGTMSEAMRLVGVPDDVMVGADAYLDSIVNFQEDTPGAPKIRFAGPAEVMEGDAVDVTVNIIDVGGPSTWTWDLNGDGTFGDTPGATDYSIPMGTTDGPSTVRIGVQATNGTATSQRYRAITVDNVAPMAGPPLPPAVTTNGADYTYQFNVIDPAGTMDPPNFACTTCPTTMTISSTGFLQWTPGDLDVTMPMMPHHVQVTIDDGDMGVTHVAWDLTVLADHPPSRPTILYPSGIVVSGVPRLAAGNSTDVDGDPLSYVFQIDTVETFDSPALETSPMVPQTDGFTTYTPTHPLLMGTHYQWRVKANDTFVDSDWATGSFYTEGTAPGPDMGVPDAGSTDGSTMHADAGGGGDHGGCCAVAGTSGTGTSALAVVAGLALAVVARRRRLPRS